MSGSLVLLTSHITQSVCNNLTIEEAIQLWKAYNQVFPGFKLRCTFPINDPDQIVLFLPQIDRDSESIIREITNYGSKGAFKRAIKRNHVPVFKFLLNTEDVYDREDLLEDVISSGNVELLQILMEKEHYPPQDVFDEMHFDANGSVLDYILSLYPDIDIEKPHQNGRTALMNAAGNHAYNNIRVLIEHGANVNNVDDKGMTPLMISLDSRGIVDKKLAISELLKGGADPNIPDNEGNTPLLKAIELGIPDLVNLLLDFGANPNLIDRHGISPLLKVIITQNQKTNPPEIIDSNSVVFLRILLEAGADPNIPSANGTTPLYLAILSKLPWSVELLLEHGADPNLANNDGFKPIDVAATLVPRELSEEITNLLIAYGAKTKLRNLSWSQRAKYLRQKF